jgi:ribosomal protein L18E
MPIGPHRTVSQGVNVRDLERVFEAGAEVTLEVLKEKRLIRSLRVDVKILGEGELTKGLTVTAHRFSQAAREKIEAAGGTVVALREPSETKSRKARKVAAAKRAAGIALPAEPDEAEETAAPDSPPEEPETD